MRKATAASPSSSSRVFGAVEYPGRGLAIGRDVDGVPFFAYWLTGRSSASQARELVVHDRELIVRDTSGGPPDDLRHYTAAIRGDDWVIVGNGTQVSELIAAHEHEQHNGSGSARSFDLQLAVRRITYEPDPPIRTPRITAAATITGTTTGAITGTGTTTDTGTGTGTGAGTITGTTTIAGTGLADAVVASACAQSTAPDRTEHPSLYAAELPPATALTTTTYQGTAEHVVINGRPRTVAVPISWSAITDAVWAGLTPSLRVAMVTVRLDQDTFAGAAARSR